MYKNLINKHTIINSVGEFIVFQLGNSGKINCSFYDSENTFLKDYNLYKENILIYSVIIDEKDIIHLVALSKSGCICQSKTVPYFNPKLGQLK